VNLLVYTHGGKGTAWLDAFVRALPEAKVRTWPDAPAIDADYAAVWKPPIELLGSLARVKAVFNLGAGVDGIAEMPALPTEVPLVRLEDAGMAPQMVEYVAHAVLHRHREFDAYAEQQRAGVWKPRRRVAKSSFGVGILGLGTLGSAVAASLAPFGFPLHGWSRSSKAIPGLSSHTGATGLVTVLRAAQVLVCLLALTRETRHLLDRGRLSQLPRGAYVVNVSRGDILVDEDLLALLDECHLSGAMLDVFRDEPLPASHAFWHHPKVTITPHVSAATIIDESVAQVAQKIRCLEAGLPISGVVVRGRGY